MPVKSVTTSKPICIECRKPLSGNHPAKKFCSGKCKSNHHVQRFFALLERTTVTLSQAADYYRVSVSTVRYHIKRRNIETFQLDRALRLRQSDMLHLFD